MKEGMKYRMRKLGESRKEGRNLQNISSCDEKCAQQQFNLTSKEQKNIEISPTFMAKSKLNIFLVNTVIFCERYQKINNHFKKLCKIKHISRKEKEKVKGKNILKNGRKSYT